MRTAVECFRTIQPKPERDTSVSLVRASPDTTQLAQRMDSALMFERKLSPDGWGLIAEIAHRLREQSGALTLLLYVPQGPARVRSIRMPSANRGRVKSLPSRSSRRTHLLSRFSRVGTQTPRTLKESLHTEHVLDGNPLDAECRGVRNRALVDVTSHNRAIRLHHRLSRVSVGIVHATFHHPQSHLNYLPAKSMMRCPAARGTR